ncbi:MAG: ABC transporter permease, partial [Firmicutes bacterium]|nr:ABC transporter permease [Bacillota bacterium]
LTLYHLKQQPPRHLIPWEALIIREQRTVSSYYRLAHQFIDVPYIGNEVKNRPAFGFFYKWLPPTPENSYLYLYLRTFFRYREPFGVYIRLTLVTAAMMAFLRFEWWMAALTLAGGLYLTGVQLPWIRRIHRYQPWFRLYPRPVEQKQKDWSRLAVGLLAVQAVLILLPQWWLWQAPVTLLPLFLLLGWIIAWFLGRVYLPKRLHKKSSLL